MNSSARITVAITPSRVPRRLPSISEWCAYVTVAPDDSRRIVFSRGTSYGDSGSIPCGGQCAPSSTVGARALWKKAQKMLMKKNTSLTMNRATPRDSPFCTAKVWFPRYVPSADTSRNHRIIANSVDRNPRTTNVRPLANPWKYITPPDVRDSRANDVSRGHGDGSTRWNGCPWYSCRAVVIV